LPTTNAAVAASSASAAEEEEEEEQLLALDDYLPPSHPLRSLLDATSDACVPLEVDGINANGDGSFRYEWGTWCSRVKLDALSDRALGELRLRAGAYDDLLRPADDGGAATDNKGGGRRIRIASGKYWDVVLHLLPRGARVQHKWPEGSWTVLQPLTGVIEVSQLRGPDGDGYYVPTRPKDLRGGGGRERRDRVGGGGGRRRRRRRGRERRGVQHGRGGGERRQVPRRTPPPIRGEGDVGIDATGGERPSADRGERRCRDAPVRRRRRRRRKPRGRRRRSSGRDDGGDGLGDGE
jgi:hypothetical protein